MRGVLLAALLVLGCAAVDESPSAEQELLPTASEPFVLGRNDAGGIRGAMFVSSLIVRFESTSSSAIHVSTVQLGDKRFTFRRDDAKGEFTVDGGNASLSLDELAALRALHPKVQRLWVEDELKGPAAPIPMFGAMLLGEIAWLSEHRAFATIAHFVRTRSALAPRIHPTLPSPGPVGETTFDYGAEPFTNRGLYCANDYDDLWLRAYTTPWNGSENVREEQLAKVNGTGGTSEACEGGVSNQGMNGCGDWACQGQCGVGCQPWWRSGRFTDCFEHDVCTDWHADADCDRDKYFAASAYVDSYVGHCR